MGLSLKRSARVAGDVVEGIDVDVPRIEIHLDVNCRVIVIRTLLTLTVRPGTGAIKLEHGVSVAHLVTGVRGALTSMMFTPFCRNRAVITLTFSSGSDAPPHTTVTAPSLIVTRLAPDTVTLLTPTR